MGDKCIVDLSHTSIPESVMVFSLSHPAIEAPNFQNRLLKSIVIPDGTEEIQK